MENFFRMNSAYHYYEDPVYEPYKRYFAGFGERQCKRFHTALSHGASFYNQFCSVLKAKQLEAIEITDEEYELKEFAREMTIKIIKFRDGIFKFKRTTREGEMKNNYTGGSRFEQEFMRQYKSDRWVKDIERLENQKYVKFKNGHGYGETEEYMPSAKELMSRAASEIHSFVHWAHWLDYLLTGIFEAGGENDGSEDFDLSELNHYLEDCNRLLELVKKVPYLNKKEFWSEVGKK